MPLHYPGIIKSEGHTFMLVPWCGYCRNQGHQEPSCRSKEEGIPPRNLRGEETVWCSICWKKDQGHDESNCPRELPTARPADQNSDGITPCAKCRRKNHTTEEHRNNYQSCQERVNALSDQTGQSDPRAPIARGVDYPLPEAHTSIPMKPVVKVTVDSAAKIGRAHV